MQIPCNRFNRYEIVSTDDKTMKLISTSVGIQGRYIFIAPYKFKERQKLPTCIKIGHGYYHPCWYSTSHRKRQNETHSNVFGGQTQMCYHAQVMVEQSSAQSMISTRSKTAANQSTSLR